MSTRRKRRGGSGVGIVPTIAVVVVVLIVVVGGVFIAVSPTFNPLAAARSTGDDFMNALQTNDFTKAYTLMTSTYQSVFGRPAAMQKAFSDAGWEPNTYSITRTELAPSGKTVVNGMGTFAGATKFFFIFLLKIGDTWRITGFKTENNQPNGIPGA